MGKIYTLSIADAYFYAARDVLGMYSITRPVAIREIELTQHTLVGESQERKLGVALRYGVGIEPGFYTGVTPVPREAGDPGFPGLCYTNPTDTAVFINGDELKGRWDWDVRGGLFLPFDGDDRPVVSPASGMLMTLHLETAPATYFYLSCSLVLEVLGG